MTQLTFQECKTLIDEKITSFLTGERKPSGLYEPAGYQMNLGGKRIRPILTLMACNLFSDEVDAALMPAIALETFHNFTLVHDDIMDNAMVRRGQPTIHTQWTPNTAILSGDTLCILAYQYLAETTPSLIPRILGLFNQMALQVCEGQQYDLDFEKREDVSYQEYMLMIEYKTAVLQAVSLKIGALIGGASEPESEKLYQFGRNLGLAFQIQDDLLDVYADETVFGKAIGGDIRENKKTWLLIKALELAKGQRLDALHAAIRGGVSNPEEKYMRVREIYDDLNISVLAEHEISLFFEQAMLNLKEVDVTPERKTELKKLAAGLIRRDK